MTMDPKQAVQFAKKHAAEMLGPETYSLEEIEFETYKGKDVWSITLGYPRALEGMFALLGSGVAIQYKIFLIDAETGELVAIKMRETVSS